jgi:hypothetical protein
MKYWPIVFILVILIATVLIGMGVLLVKATGFIGGIIYILAFVLLIVFNRNKV